jgi:hypothetical protein
MTAILSAPANVLARGVIPELVIWHADGRFTRLEGATRALPAPPGVPRRVADRLP